MSSLNPITYGKKEEQIFLGREIAKHQSYSEDTAIKIDQQVNTLIIDQYNRARRIIVENKDALARLGGSAARARVIGLGPDSPVRSWVNAR